MEFGGLSKGFLNPKPKPKPTTKDDSTSGSSKPEEIPFIKASPVSKPNLVGQLYASYHLKRYLFFILLKQGVGGFLLAHLCDVFVLFLNQDS